MSIPTVLIAGCGITGPVLALLLRRRGYKPVIIEKVRALGDAGLTLGLFPNGLKVLSVAGVEPGGIAMEKGTEYTAEGECLGTMNQTSFVEVYGHAARMVRRSDLSRVLRDEVVKYGIPIHLGWELKDMRETEDGVVAVAEDGREVSASILVGCDGLHSATRRWVLGRHGRSELAADTTGLVMVGGFCPKVPEIKEGYPCTWYGEAKYALAFQVDQTTSVWGVVLPAPDEKENWQQENNVAEQTATLLKQIEGWPQPLRTSIATTTKLVKFGLYDRPELTPEEWSYGRCVLLGDAAHPTSPHQGQGANQSLEDCWHLSQMLPEATDHISTDELTKIFRRYAEKRQPRTAMMVKQARMQGNIRVTHGKEACQRRNEMVKKMWADEEAVKARMHDIFKEPF